MEIQALGYLGFGAENLEDWTDFATARLGMQSVDRGAGLRAFRMDDRRQRLVADASLPTGTRYYGWEVADAMALDALATKLERAGVSAKCETVALADQRCVSGLISFADPAGNRLEAFYGPQVADTPFRPGRMVSGFRCGPLGMGHVLMTTTNMAASLGFYRDLLGLTASTRTRPEAPQNGAAFGLDLAQWDAWILHDARGFGAGLVVDLLEWQVPAPTGRPNRATDLGHS